VGVGVACLKDNRQRHKRHSLDYPKPDGTTTYTDLVKFFGDQGAYFDIGSENNNLFQIPDQRNLPDTRRQKRLDDYKEFLVKAY
jgi:hypothetical protein